VPTYQYSCTDCGHFFEAVQSFTDDSLTVCPECEGRLRKVFNAVGVVFKGSGFYRTDSRSQQEGAKASAKEGSKDGSKDAAKSESSSNGASKTDSKPATSGSSSSTPSPAA
jgi:putative FmdB family regulatory protein